MTDPDWNALIPELKDWNNGSGIDPESWVGCVGNFKLASAYSLIFWPSFTEMDGMVFRGEIDRATLESWKGNCSRDPKSMEATVNHIHILDLHHAGCPDASVERIVFLGKVLKEIYSTKLAVEFPQKSFIVDFYEPEDQNLQDYQLTFYQRHDS